MNSQTLYTACTLATMVKGQVDYGLQHDAAIVCNAGRIDWAGELSALPEQYRQLEPLDLGQRLVTPALIDCHTHLVFGGNRAREFEMRLGGASYEEISLSGGGIKSTVSATRSASNDELFSSALRRLDSLLSEGVGVVEVKSGYGLTIEDELRMLQVARQLGEARQVKIVTTWLAAHTVPQEYAEHADKYIDDVVIPGLKLAHDQGLVDAVDGFCEKIAFSTEQIERVFKAATELGLPVKLHAEQLSNQQGAALTALYKGLSADHLEYLSEEDVPDLANSGTVAVLLPGAFYCLKETKQPPVDSLRSHGVDIAVATDCNPGTSPISSILSAMNMACIEFGLTPEESLAGATRCAAKALGLENDYGLIQSGYVSNLAVWELNHPAELSYWVGASPLYKRLS